MGFTSHDVKFLLSAYELGLKDSSVLTLGRQGLFMTPGEVTSMLQAHGRAGNLSKDKASYYADDIFESLGFKCIDSMDASAFEGASIVHDLNHQVPELLHGRYDLVWDGGTLEHVFNFPTAIANAMQMVKVGGHLVLVTPANNQCGHGFYQFSPELFFRVLSPENGFELIRIYMTGEGGPYHVADPAAVGGRVELLNSDGALLMVHARKLREAKPFSTMPQQSDYVSAWGASKKADGRLKQFLRRVLSPPQVRAISRILNKLHQRKAVRTWRKESRLTNRRLYTPVTRWDKPSPRHAAQVESEKSL